MIENLNMNLNMKKGFLEISKSEDGVVQISFLQKSRQVDGIAVYSFQQNLYFCYLSAQYISKVDSTSFWSPQMFCSDSKQQNIESTVL